MAAPAPAAASATAPAAAAASAAAPSDVACQLCRTTWSQGSKATGFSYRTDALDESCEHVCFTCAFDHLARAGTYFLRVNTWWFGKGKEICDWGYALETKNGVAVRRFDDLKQLIHLGVADLKLGDSNGGECGLVCMPAGSFFKDTGVVSMPKDSVLWQAIRNSPARCAWPHATADRLDSCITQLMCYNGPANVVTYKDTAREAFSKHLKAYLEQGYTTWEATTGERVKFDGLPVDQLANVRLTECEKDVLRAHEKFEALRAEFNRQHRERCEARNEALKAQHHAHFVGYLADAAEAAAERRVAVGGKRKSSSTQAGHKAKHARKTA